MAANSVLEIVATLRTTGQGGIVFDRYSDNDFKFVLLDVPGQRVLVGHVKGGATKVAASVARSLLPTRDHVLQITLRGLAVSVSLDGSFALSHAFNGVPVDGGFGLLAAGGTTSVDGLTIRSDDRAFREEADALQGDGDASTLGEAQLATLVEEGRAAWAARLGAGDPRLARLDGVRFAVADLAEGFLGMTKDDVVFVDVAAGARAREVVEHELGHVIGLEHEDAGQHAIMTATVALADVVLQLVPYADAPVLEPVLDVVAPLAPTIGEPVTTSAATTPGIATATEPFITTTAVASTLRLLSVQTRPPLAVAMVKRPRRVSCVTTRKARTAKAMAHRCAVGKPKPRPKARKAPRRGHR